MPAGLHSQILEILDVRCSTVPEAVRAFVGVIVHAAHIKNGELCDIPYLFRLRESIQGNCEFALM